MFGIGGQELFIILIIALIVLGPKKLPDLAKSLGRALGEFQRATQDLKREIDISGQVRVDEKPSDAKPSGDVAPQERADGADQTAQSGNAASPHDQDGEQAEHVAPSDEEGHTLGG
ncbi:MAG: twin-arginine translocase TatA/TatE family subunit [Syntrophaceae bacterium]